MDFATWAKSKYVVEIPIKKSWVTELYDITPHVVSNQQTFVVLWVFFCLKGVCSVCAITLCKKLIVALLFCGSDHYACRICNKLTDLR